MISPRIARMVLVFGFAAVAWIALSAQGARAQQLRPPARRANVGRDAAHASLNGSAANAAPIESAVGIDVVARAQGLYERLCLPCHAASGTGDGPLARFLEVAPRDFVHQPFKWRTTASGTGPMLDDVALTIARGVPGAMPAFGRALRPEDRRALARLVLAFRAQASSVPLSPAPTQPAASIARGAEVFQRLQCAACHGATLHGDGPAARTQSPRPYDLTRVPPRGGADPDALLRSLRSGIDGTSMPSFESAASIDDLRSLAAWLAAQIPVAVASMRADNDPGVAHWLTESDASALETPAPTGLLDPLRIARERTFWDRPLAPQGDGPPQLTPAEHSLSPQRCARCHAQQFAQFGTTVHAAAMGPGVLGQLIDMSPREVFQCQSCHAPLAEQSPDTPRIDTALSTAMVGGPSPRRGDAHAAFAPNGAFDAELRSQGVVCAACHLRGRERFGPPARAASGRLAGSLYPLTTLSQYERGDFCASCHQHTPADSAGGHPILDTVGEWVAGPYFARGVQCQHCHMPDREHTWRGAHDPEAVRQALHVYVRFERTGAVLEGSVAIENTGAGHAFPGTATPAAVLELEWLNAHGERVGAAVIDVIQRRLEWDGRSWVQRSDTRIAPGGQRVTRATTTDRRAVALRYTLTFRPDDYYEGFYTREVGRAGRSERGRAMLRVALDNSRRSAFVVRSDAVPVPSE